MYYVGQYIHNIGIRTSALIEGSIPDDVSGGWNMIREKEIHFFTFLFEVFPKKWC